jgi:NAD+ kinase
VKALFRSVGIVARYDKKGALKLTDDLAEHLKAKGLAVYLEDTLTGKTTKKHETLPLKQMKTDFLITIGGDGTILRTCITLPKPEPPILAVNMGVRGFMTEVEPDQALNAVDKILDNEYSIEKCMKLQVTADGLKCPEALNETVMLADDPTKVLYAKILKDNEPILNCQADGLIASTQTGSTGYSFSAEGPVLDPEVDAFVLTPLCPMSLFRPIVFPAKSTLTIEVEKPKEILVLIDGHIRQTIKSKLPSLTITKSKYETSFIRFKEDFYHRLRSRLLFKGTG